jgi:hypothetical protein
MYLKHYKKVMNMKLCPYCGKALTEKALACKHCGEWLEDISDYLEKKGSVYAHTDSVSLQIDENTGTSKRSSQLGKNQCVFCKSPANLNETEIKEKVFVCIECGKKNIVTNGQIDEVLRNVPVGWGWIVLTGCITIAIQKYLYMLDDILQIIVTSTLSVFILLLIYFLIRRFILKERYEKKKFFGKIYDASLISGTISMVGVALFIFVLHFAYPLTGLQSDRKETDLKIKYYKSIVSEISSKQKEINDVISKPISSKEEAAENTKLLDEYINLNNEEKKYVDSIYQTLGESNYYSGEKESKKKINEANILINKIIAHKIMSAQNLKSYYLSGNEKSLVAIRELNLEILALSKEYSKNYQDLFIEE